MSKIQKTVEIKNKKAGFEYELLDRFTAGIKLVGTEIKAIREGKANINDAYCYFVSGELYVKEMHVSEYSWGSYSNHEPRRERKLLLNKKELVKLQRRSQEKGLTIIALRLFINGKGFAKLDISLARGKKQFDKRENLKTKDVKREIDRMMKR
jgi:SsrA-binding protein